MSQNASTKNKPAHEIRFGLVKAVIWANPTKSNGVMHNVMLTRLYRDDKGEWQQSNSLGRDELLVAGKVLDAAHTWICETEQERAAQ
jgi:hypothetical protein